MKIITITIYILAVILGFIIGIFVEKTKTQNIYNDACRMSDCIRYCLDDTTINSTVKHSCDIFLWNDTIENRVVPLNDYSYCY